MRIERNIGDYVIYAEDSVVNALKRIGENKSGIVFALDQSGRLEGVMTDGDFRRWVTSTSHIDLSTPVSAMCNRQYLALGVDEDYADIEKHFDARVTVIPLIDRLGHLMAVAFKSPKELTIGRHKIGEKHPAFLIAEIGNNHNGSLELAKQLIEKAAEAGADCAKFQMRNMATMYRNTGDAADPSEDLGAQYTLDLLARFQLSEQALFEAFDHCKSLGMEPLCTPWDEESLASLERYGMQAYKLASADLSNHDLLQAMARTGKLIIASTGMSNEAEIRAAVKVLQRNNANFVLLHCNSTYPAPFKDINLNYLDRLSEISGGPVGYSGHERGFHVAVAAIAKGAKVIEKHFTLDRDMEGNDHRVSLLPDEFRQMVQSIREVEEALGNDDPRRVTQGEMMNREVLAKSLIINCDLQKGQTIQADMVEVRSPGKGLQPYRRDELIGRKAKHDFKKGDFFYPSDLEIHSIEARPYGFRRPFGVPVRYHDFAGMVEKSNFTTMEFHLSYKDLDVKISDFVKGKWDMDLVVHSPELFEGDHVMDLCSLDPEYRERSIAELQRVVNVTRELKQYFKKDCIPPIIINAGGFSMDGFVDDQRRAQMHEQIAESLARIDTDGVEIIPQTMPPFPWHFGGQRYHNAFMHKEDIQQFCEKYGYRICLDVSHSQLTCNQYGQSFREFMECVAPFVAHSHLVDAKGVDEEGLQIGDGHVDFGMVAEVLDRCSPHSSFIPEIWQGHKNGGEGFWLALDRLERWF